jgi:hypothetical protein
MRNSGPENFLIELIEDGIAFTRPDFTDEGQKMWSRNTSADVAKPPRPHMAYSGCFWLKIGPLG